MAAEEKVMIVVVDGSTSWWVFRPTRAPDADWKTCRGHWYHPVPNELEARLREAKLIDADDRCFEKRGFPDEIPRFSVFRANVVVRRVPKQPGLVAMCAEDIAVADDEFRALSADIQRREQNGETVVVALEGEETSKAHRPKAEKEPLTQGESRYLIGVNRNESIPEPLIWDSVLNRGFACTSQDDTYGVSFFTQSRAKFAEIVGKTSLSPDQVHRVSILDGRELLIVSSELVPRPKSETPVVKKTNMKNLRRKETAPSDSDIRQSLPSRRGPRPEAPKKESQTADAPSQSLLLCSGFNTWTISSNVGADLPRVGSEMSMPRPSAPTVFYVGNDTFVTTVDRQTVEDLAKNVNQWDTVEAAVDHENEDYLEDLFASIQATRP